MKKAPRLEILTISRSFSSLKIDLTMDQTGGAPPGVPAPQAAPLPITQPAGVRGDQSGEANNNVANNNVPPPSPEDCAGQIGVQQPQQQQPQQQQPQQQQQNQAVSQMATGIPPTAAGAYNQQIVQTAAAQAVAALAAIANQAAAQQQQQHHQQQQQQQQQQVPQNGGNHTQPAVDPNIANFLAALSSQQQGANLFSSATLAAQLGGILPMMLGSVQGANPAGNQFPQQQAPIWFNPAMMNGNMQSVQQHPQGPGVPNQGPNSAGTTNANPAVGQSGLVPQQQGAAFHSPQAAGGVQAAAAVAENNRKVTVPLFLDFDREVLTEYQCLLRQQIELFEAGPEDIQENVKGRIKPVRVGQLGIRCRHCSARPPDARARGAMYFAYNIEGVYQLAQNMGKKHIGDSCREIPPGLKQRLNEMYRSKENNNRRAGGKAYWVESLAVLGVYKDKASGMLKIKPPR